jgi:hypothetical protein
MVPRRKEKSSGPRAGMLAVMKIVRILLGLAAGLVVLCLLLLVAVLVINRHDQPPSASAISFGQLVANRPAVPDADNAYVYILGFDAPADADPREIGAQRLQWLATYSDTADAAKKDPLAEPLILRKAASAEASRVDQLCQADDRQYCVEAFGPVADNWRPTPIEQLALARYQALLQYRAWREVVPMDLEAPLPPYSDIAHAQRLQFLRLMSRARGVEPAEIRAALQADFVYWRGALASADGLIGKMIARSALRNHFFFANLVLKRVPADRVAACVPAGWDREITDEERKLDRALAGELASMERLLRDLEKGEGPGMDESTGEDRLSRRLLRRFGVPLYQPQHSINAIADMFQAVTSGFDVPIDQYAAVAAKLAKSHEKWRSPVSLYNPVGEYIVGKYDIRDWIDYAIRPADFEGERRLAVLVARLRARGVPPDGVGSEVLHAGLRNPFDGQPFEWDAGRNSVLFTSPGKNRFRQLELFY